MNGGRCAAVSYPTLILTSRRAGEIGNLEADDSSVVSDAENPVLSDKKTMGGRALHYFRGVVSWTT